MHSSKYLKIPETSGTFSIKATIKDSVVLKPWRHDSTSEVTWRLVKLHSVVEHWENRCINLWIWNNPSHIVSTARRSKKRWPLQACCIAVHWGKNNVSAGLAHTNSSSTNFITHKHLSFETCSSWPDPACGVCFFCHVWRNMGWERAGGGGCTLVFFSEPNV